MGRKRPAPNADESAAWRNVPGYIYLNGDVVEEIRQLSGAGGKGTVDELGFQVLYDRIAQPLFPWCSTLTSRARYFFFSLAVLEIALQEAVDDALIDPNRDANELGKLAEQKRGTFMRTVRRIERALALSLVTKHATAERGIFGSIRCRRWFRENAEVSGRGKILSADGRYPNAIYRGSCRALTMFGPKDSSTTGFLRARLSGLELFDRNWHAHSKIVLATVRQLDEFWQGAVRANLTFSRAASELAKLPAYKTFSGFALREEEAHFLYERIQQVTRYFRDVPLKQLPSLVKQPELDLQQLKQFVSDSKWHELFDAAYHIDAVTRPFRGLYQECADDRSTAEQRKLPIQAIRKSKEWLDERSKSSKLDWAAVWSADMSLLLEDWLIYARKGPPSLLLDALCERAERVVRSRGQGKKAPHEKRGRESEREDETDLKNELDVRETSFRLGNGTLVLKDVAAAIAVQ
jgi:hypothetical protein